MTLDKLNDIIMALNDACQDPNAAPELHDLLHYLLNIQTQIEIAERAVIAAHAALDAALHSINPTETPHAS